MSKKRWVSLAFGIVLSIAVVTLWRQRISRQQQLDQAFIRAIVDQQRKESRRLLAQGADPNSIWIWPRTADGIMEYISNILPDYDPNLDGRQDTALILAVQSQDVDLVTDLLKRGADVNGDDRDGRTALMEAVEQGRADLVRLLLQRGASINERDSQGNTALGHARFDAYLAMTDLLLSSGADPNIPDSDGGTSLMYAVATGNVPLTRLLLRKGADPNVRDLEGDTALKLAMKGGNHTIIQELRQAGARQ